jgi:hypothetical protein
MCVTLSAAAMLRLFDHVTCVLSAIHANLSTIAQFGWRCVRDDAIASL